MKPSISIIIVTYNSGFVLENCINSIQTLLPLNIEIIVVDNHPEQLDIIQFSTLFPDVRFIDNHINDGFGAGNNRGSEVAKGNILFFLNPDTELILFDFKKLEEHYQNHPRSITGFPIVYPNGKYCKPFKFIPEIDFILPKGIYDLIYTYVLRKNKSISSLFHVSGAAFCISSELFDILGGFDENIFLFFEENDLRMRAVKNKEYHPYILADHFRVVHHEGKSYNQNAISWYVSSLKFFAAKYNKNYLRFYKIFCVICSIIVRSILRRKTDSHKLLVKELRRKNIC